MDGSQATITLHVLLECLQNLSYTVISKSTETRSILKNETIQNTHVKKKKKHARVCVGRCVRVLKEMLKISIAKSSKYRYYLRKL